MVHDAAIIHLANRHFAHTSVSIETIRQLTPVIEDHCFPSFIKSNSIMNCAASQPLGTLVSA